MILQVLPTSRLQGRINFPASKSYSIRAFMIAACGGSSEIRYPSDCDDARVARSAARALGACLAETAPGVFRVEAHQHQLRARSISVRESGTVLRFLLPLLSLQDRPVTVRGRGTLQGRPNYHLTDVLRSQGVQIKGEGTKESIPIKLSGGTLNGGRIRIAGTVSSQFISALMIACPRLIEATTLQITGRRIVSADYIAMTRAVLAKSGVRVDALSEREYFIPGGQRFRGLRMTIPSDDGLAAFLLAAAVLTSSSVFFGGAFDPSLIQADSHIWTFLNRMGVTWQKTKRSVRIDGPQTLRGGTFSLRACPDLVPVMAVLALFARGPTRLTHIQHARHKESDRISDLRKELLKIGADVRETPGTLTIRPQTQYRPDVLLDSHRDHRLAMAFTVLGLKSGVRIKDIECVRKSYPAFVRDMRALGARVRNVRSAAA